MNRPENRFKYSWPNII